jgi:hypothetical protein
LASVTSSLSAPSLICHFLLSSMPPKITGMGANTQPHGPGNTGRHHVSSRQPEQHRPGWYLATVCRTGRSSCMQPQFCACCRGTTAV